MDSSVINIKDVKFDEPSGVVPLNSIKFDELPQKPPNAFEKSAPAYMAESEMMSQPGTLEGLGSLASGAVSWIPAGLSMFSFDRRTPTERAKTAKDIQDSLTYVPKSPVGQKIAEIGAYPFTKMAEAGEKGGQYLDEKGYPVLGMLSRIAGEGAPFLIPPLVKGAGVPVRAVRRNVKELGGMEGVLEPIQEVRTPRNIPAENVVPLNKIKFDEPAEVVPVDKIKFDKQPKASVYADIIEEASATHGVDPSLIQSVIQAESAGKKGAVSPKGAQGLMQIMPDTAKDLGITDPYDPVQNINGGTKYLADLLKRYNGNEEQALAAYNWGMGRVDKLVKNGTFDISKLPAETQGYLKRISESRNKTGIKEESKSDYFVNPEAIKTVTDALKESGIDDPLSVTRKEATDKLSSAGKDEAAALVWGDVHWDIIRDAYKAGIDVPKRVLDSYKNQNELFKNIIDEIDAERKAKTRPDVPEKFTTIAMKQVEADYGAGLKTETVAAMAPDKDFTRREPTIAEGEIPTDITKRSDIVNFLKEKLDIPIRTGGFKQRALGIFKPKAEVIRTAKANDIEVISHEVGHGLQKYLFPDSVSPAGAVSAKPFSAYKNELGPIATKPGKGGAVLPEGFAEFIRLYVVDPQKAVQKAPRFHEYFEKLLAEKAPEIREILLEARNQYDKWLKQPSLQRVLAQISIGEKLKRPITFDDAYKGFIDDLNPLKNIVKEMSKGEKLPVSQDPYALARLMRGWVGKAEAFMRNKTFDFNTYKDTGKGLQEIVKPLDGKLDEFRAYMVSRRTVELKGRGIETGISRADAQKVIQDYDAQFSKAFSELKVYQDNTLRYLKDSGMMDDKTYIKIKALNDDYVPLYRIMDEKGNIGGMGKGLEARNAIKKIKGSWRDIQDPLESVIKNTYLYINIAEKNAIGTALVNLAERGQGMGKYVEKIPTPTKGIKFKIEEIFDRKQLNDLALADIDLPDEAVIFRPNAFTPKDNVISVWKNGKQNLYQVHPDVAQTFKALDREGTNFLIKVLSYPAQWLRAGATLTPEFIGRNPLRDQWSAFVYSKYGFVPGYDLVKGVFHLAGKDEVYWNWKKGGGDHSMLVSMDRSYLQENIKDLMSSVNIPNLVKNPLEALRLLSEIGEAGTRIGEFGKGISKEGMTKEGIQQAALAAREVSLDFARRGAIGKAINQITAFWNAQIQGTDKMIRAFKENPGATSMKVAAAITLPSVLLAIANNDDPRIKEIPQWQKDLFWLIPTKDTVYRIPKPFELGILFGSVPERITRYLLTQDPHAFDKVLDSISRGFSPGVLPTGSIPFIENFANRSTFFDRPIVPESKKDMLPQYQYGTYTTETAKQIGNVLARIPGAKDYSSPAKIENLVRGWTGGLGMYAMNIADKGLELTGVTKEQFEKPAKTLADIPFIKAFVVRYPSASAESIQRFYDNYQESKQVSNTINLVMKKEMNPDEGQRLMKQYPVEKLDAINTALRNMHNFIDSTYRNPTMRGEEKRVIIDNTYLQMVEIAKQGNRIHETMTKTGGTK